jgi:hypothetical protein
MRNPSGRAAVTSVPLIMRGRPGNVDGENRYVTSGQHVFDHMTVDIGEPAIEAVVIEGQALMVEAQEVEDGGVEIIDGGFVQRGFEAELVAFAIAEALFHFSTGEVRRGVRREAGEQAQARRGANGDVAMRLSEGDTALEEPVEVRCLRLRMSAEHADVVVQVIAHDEEHVRLSGSNDG